MRKVIKISEKLTIMLSDNMINILDDATFIPLTIDDMKLIIENLGLYEEEETSSKRKRSTKKSEPKIEPKNETQSVNINSETEVIEEFKEVPPKNPFI